LKTAGLVEIIKSVIDREGVEVAFVFGSLAASKEKAASDVDMLVIGAVGLRALSSWLSGVSDQIGREIHPHTMTMEEFRQRKQKGDHFLSNILESPKLFIIGNENDLAAMGR
jgi:predicted nucleotidyltransferase